MTKTVRYAAVAAKLLLLALLLAALIWPDLSGIKGKASTARLTVYPIGALVLPLWWWIRGRKGAFPWAADLLMTLPWLIDLLGNRLDLFDTVGWWDDAMHFVLWALLTWGVLLAFAPPGLSRPLTVLVALGFGTTAAVVWEIGEYVAFVRSSPELHTAYTDTLGDLALGTLGALLAGLIVGHARGAGTKSPSPSNL
ncbi:hypothetical protein [Kribbella sp. NPDC048928]|uniref:hypothetical protein n=1 Tax=Kribbella sp. NPDC048928 TaxID=3364111 RepID=UPI0037179EE1